LALYAIGDLHLSLGTDKPMDVFGGPWENYIEKIKDGFLKLKDEDTIIICGDTSWAMNIKDALNDFKFIESFRGRKILLKGNHDYWWEGVGKMKRILSENNLRSIDFLHNNFFIYENFAICGTRGWFCEEECGSEHDAKIIRRECMRLESSLKDVGNIEKLCFLHYPPKTKTYECCEIIEVMQKHDVRYCAYGHLHGKGINTAFIGDYAGIYFELISADYLNFSPKLIAPPQYA
jgi:predicted phosphohydrolase